VKIIGTYDDKRNPYSPGQSCVYYDRKIKKIAISPWQIKSLKRRIEKCQEFSDLYIVKVSNKNLILQAYSILANIVKEMRRL